MLHPGLPVLQFEEIDNMRGCMVVQRLDSAIHWIVIFSKAVKMLKILQIWVSQLIKGKFNF